MKDFYLWNELYTKTLINKDMIRRKSQTFSGWRYNDINLIVLVYTELSFDVPG